MSYKNSTAARTTITRDTMGMANQVHGNIYEALVVLSKRSNQIAKEMREELHAKLEEFATHQDNLEEVFENREQIEISKFYERLPKPHSISMLELDEEKIYIRVPDLEEEKAIKALES